jgi:VanZ family protein
MKIDTNISLISILIGILLFIFSKRKSVRAVGIILSVGVGLGMFVEISQKKLDL